MLLNPHAQGPVSATNVGAARINLTSKLVDNTGAERQGASILVRKVVFIFVNCVYPPNVNVRLSKDTMQRFFEIYRLNAKNGILMTCLKEV